jgi:predicted nucleic acid-binding protein
MKYLLDTTLLIDHALDRHGAPELVMRLFSEPNDLYVCDAVVAEALSKGTDDEVAAIERLLEALEYVATTPDAARWASASRRRHDRLSRRHLGDSIVAGVAWDFDATVVTRNPRDFTSQGVPVLAYGQPEA